MAHYPRSFREFRRRFPDGAACGDHLARTRWPEGLGLVVHCIKNTTTMTSKAILKALLHWRA